MCKGRRYSNIIDTYKWALENCAPVKERIRKGIRMILEENEVRAALRLIQEKLHDFAKDQESVTEEPAQL